MHTRTSKLGGMDATFSIAAYNASAQSKRDADYVCDGVDDQVQFNAAVARVSASGRGKIMASEGTFYVTGNSSGAIPLVSNLDIELIGNIVFTSPTPDGSKMFYGNAVHDVSIIGGKLDGNVLDANQIDGYRTLVDLAGACYNIFIDCNMGNVATYNGGTAYSTKNGANVAKTASCRSVNVINRNYPNTMLLNDRPDASSSDELVSNCDTGWTFVGAGAGYSTDHFLVSKSLLLPAATTAYTSLSSTIDFTHRTLHYMLYMTAKTSNTLALYADIFSGANYVRATFDLPKNENLIGRWIHVSVRPTAFGSVDPRIIDKIRFSTSASVPSLYIGKVWTTILPDSYVTFSFDDGLSAVEDYTAVLDAHGMRGVYAINPGQVETIAGRLTWARLADMAKIGHEIVDHGYDHIALNYDSAARCEIAGLGGQDGLIQRSFVNGARFLTLPYSGLISTEGYDALNDHMIFFSTRNMINPITSFPTYMGRYGLVSGGVTTMKALILNTYLVGGHLDMYAHSPTVYGNMSAAELEEIAAYVDSLGIPVVTYSELYDSISRERFNFATRTDQYFNVLAADADYIRSNEDLSAATPITFTLSAQPDIPRTLSWAFDSHAQITAYTMEVIGIDARGRSITETWTETAGWSGETSNAFMTITSIKMTSRTGTGAGDTMDIGITNVIGLQRKLFSVDHVLKIKKNDTAQTIVVADTSSMYGTYDFDTISLADTDDIEIAYKTND